MATMDWSTQAGEAATAYQEFLVPAMFAPFAERLVESTPVERGSRVLDIACGTGVVSRAAARRSGVRGSICGVDLGEPTLAVARSLPADADAAPIDYRQADAAALPFDADRFDVALCQQGLQFFPDRPAALGEMRRVLRDGGRVAIATWTEIERSPFGVVAEALSRHISAEAGEMMRSPFALGDGALVERLMCDALFADVSFTHETIECTWASHSDFARRALAAGPVAAVFATVPAAARRALGEEVAERLQPYRQADGSLRMPMTSNIAVARA